ncbi:hypothetical protein AB0P02_06780 [Streptomyces griseoluteus]|uniref:hypothetical protein n=1 Tax=Streptomyces griseoluteus TaxID=29306 RepID=UPI00343D44F5
MTDHSTSAPSRGTHPTEAAAAQQRLAELHQACRDDYAAAAARRTAQNHRVPGLYGTGAVTR